MKRLLAALPPILPLGAQAAPNWKKAPNAPDDGESTFGGFNLETDWQEQYGETMGQAIQFVTENYGFLGVGFVLLALVLFGRGASSRRAARATEDADDEDFFEPEEYGRTDNRR